MKKNVKKLNKKLKAILCLCLALLFSFSAFLFAGCDKDIGDIGGGSGGSGGGENQRTFFENFVSGIAAVYANSESGGDSGLESENTDLLITSIKDGLLSNYGSGKGIDTYRYSPKAPFYDSIRMLVTAQNGDINSIAKVDDARWNWFLDPNMTGNKGLTPKDNETFINWQKRMQNDPEGSYDDDEFIDSSKYNFEQFKNIFQIILYEIMLGYNETKIEVVAGNQLTGYDRGVKLTCKADYYYAKIVSCEKDQSLVGYYLFNFQKSGEASAEFNGVKYSVSFPEINQSEPDPKIQDYQASLKQEYLSKSRYVGLTKQNADKLIDYILTEIIGKKLVLDDYNNYKNQQVNFRNYVETIAYLVYSQTYDGSKEDWVYSFPSGNSTKITYTFNQRQRENAKTTGLLNESELGSFMAKPATYVKYFPGESFFGDPDATDQFAGKPYAEYQSIVIVPAISSETRKDGGIKLEAGFVFNFMTQNKNLRIIPKVRYCVYNEETGTQFFYEFAADEINFSGAQSFVNAAGQTCYEDDFDFGVDISKLDPSLVKTQVDLTGYKETTYTVGFFKNKELLDSVVDETRLTEQAGVQDFYKVVESKNGHGGTTVLNEKHIKSSFFEIVFDIVKSETDPENTDYNFSLILSNSLFYPGIY
ncbi:MAG: hypothetical protein SPF37_03845 [Eubacteriales bacterium]|nr:hypothetical protein [Eubacteriales bacterium]